MPNVYGIDLERSVPALETIDVSVTFGSGPVLRKVSMVIPSNRVVAVVGPSGCGKSVLLKCFNRLNDFNPEAEVTGKVLLFGQDVYDPGVDPAEVRRRIGMVLQDPNPFPGSIFENVAFGPLVNHVEGALGRIVEEALKRADLWAEAHDRLSEPAGNLSRGQQQRLCIARALAAGPEVLLMDEPAAELDHGASRRIEELIIGLREVYSVVLVTRNLQAAARVSDLTAVLMDGELVEYGPTEAIFTHPRERRTEAFITGRFE